MDDLTPDPAVVAADMLKAALPGFTANISPSTRVLAIQTTLRLGSQVSAETILYAVPSLPEFHRGFTGKPKAEEIAIHRANLLKATQQAVAPLVNEIVKETQRYAIEATGLQPVIDEQIRQAERRAEMAGYWRGHDAGKATGYREGKTAGLSEGFDRAARAIAAAEGDDA